MIYSKRLLFSFLLIVTILLVGCATYYQKSMAFQESFVQGQIEDANKTLDSSKKAATDQNRLLYFLQKGVVMQMLGEFEQSNQFFEQAYIYTEDFRKSYTKELASMLTNSSIKPYTGEDHELVLMHYFKAVNYLRLNQHDEALVECRRINNKLNILNDRYEKKKNRYKRDAFALNLMGMSYEGSGDINNAFIAYRNALETYEEDYKKQFNIEAPQQLKKDLLRSAYLNGFDEELKKFETLFGVKYIHQTMEGGELILFWHNGIGPVKDEWSTNFFIVKGQGGAVMFVNEELGLSFPFPITAMGQSTGGLGDLKFVRVAFPKYLERKPYYRSAEIIADKSIYKLELAENINEIAFKTLEDRMTREMANSLMRLALKQTVEQQASKQNQNLGALLSVINAVSEKADTRNWQTLPYSISYARVPLKEGLNNIKLNLYSPQKSVKDDQELEFEVVKGQTVFHVFNSLESIPLQK